jgi:hypothetical protein
MREMGGSALDAETWVMFLILIGCLLLMIRVGYRVPNRIRGTDIYILAGRNLPWFGVAPTFLATIANVNQVLGRPRFARCNGVYKEFFAQDPPARTTIGADLWGIHVEVDCVSVVRGAR